MDDLNKGLFDVRLLQRGPGAGRQLRREAEKRGLNPNVWFNNVEIVAAEKIGAETVTYVEQHLQATTSPINGGRGHGAAKSARRSSRSVQTRAARRSRSALAMTDTELNVIAALAQIGLMSMPVNGIQHAGRDRHARPRCRRTPGTGSAGCSASSRGSAAARGRCPRRSPLHERDAGALDGDVGAGAHGDADVACAASAGASLMPSPAIATTRPSRCSRRRPRAFCRAAPRRSPRRCRPARHRLAVARLSPVSITMRRPSACSSRDRLGRRRLDRIRDADEASQRPSTATNMTVCPALRGARRRALRAAASMPFDLAAAARVPTSTAVPRRCRRRPCP